MPTPTLDLLKEDSDMTMHSHVAGDIVDLPAGVTDHGALTGLADDDHTQYVLNTGDTMTGPLTVSSATLTAIAGTTATAAKAGVYGTSGTSTGYGVYGLNNSATGVGVLAQQSSTGYALYATGGKNYFSGDVGIGVLTPSALLHGIKTTEQLRLGYDASNYFSATVGSTGAVTLDAVGSGAKFLYSDTLQVGTSPATYLYTTGVLDVGLNITLATKPALSREGNSGVVSNLWVGVPKPSGLTTGYENLIFAGDSGATTAGKSITSGYKNTLIGAGAGYNITTGFSNLFIGTQTAASVTGGGGNIGIGAQALYGANPNNCVAIGAFAGYNLQTGYGVYIGDRASYSQQYGYHNCSIGDYTLYSNSGGSDNVSVGWYSGYHITGNRNVTLGAFAGNNSAFSGIDDQLIIANSTTATPLIYGNFSTAILTFNGGLIVNEQGGDYDTRIESQTYDALFIDASDDAIAVMNNASGKVSFFGATPVTKQTELTDELTTITFTAPSTPDYAIQDLTNTGGFGFATKDEGNSVLAVVANLQARVNELETKLVNYGLLIDAD